LDWLNLLGVLAIPVVLAVASLWFSAEQAQVSQLASDRQHQTDVQLALDQQRETTLQTFVNNMQDLLLNHNLRQSAPSDGVRVLARARTLSALASLDPKRKRALLQFLYEARLIDRKYPIVGLDGADLSATDLSGASLSGVSLSDADLSKAILNDADLSGADLSGADLSSASLNFAILSDADLSSVDLSKASLNFTNLNGADLNLALQLHFKADQ
jgi:uncharacterized protein YjbI with pentapeptide repeats